MSGLLSVSIMLIAAAGVLAAASFVCMRTRAFSPMTPVLSFTLVFLLTLLLQGFHWVEHIAQVIQAFVLQSPNAHGLIGQLDLEQVHFVFNTLYLALMAYILLQWIALRDEFPVMWGLYTAIIGFTLLIQTYHEVEHSVKYVQYLRTNVQGTPGILGAHVNGIWLHFWMNAIVLWPLVAVFFCAGVFRKFPMRELISVRGRA